MTAKEFMERIKDVRACDKAYLAIKSELDARKVACKQIYMVADSVMSTRPVQYDREHVSGSKHADLSNVLMRLDKAVDRMAKSIIRRQTRQVKVLAIGISVINSVQDEWVRAVLIDLYISGMTMEKAAEHLSLSFSSIRRYKDRGLAELDERYKDFSRLATRL